MKKFKKCHYYSSCVDLDGFHIQNMVDNSKEITYETFCRHCDYLPFVEFYGYVIHGNGLKLKDDLAVSFHKSKYRGTTCYYIDHSAIEHIWM